jgi:hypothetical protein
MNDPKIDLAVANAIGLKHISNYHGPVLITPREWDEIRGIDHPTCEGGVACVLFRPSTDLNDAFAAAEVVFATNDWVVGKDFSWGSFRCKGLLGGESFDECAPTPALAICVAILKLKEESK